MKIELKPEQEQFIQSQIQKGLYETVEQALDEALQLLKEHSDRTSTTRLEELRQKIDIGTQQIAAGQVTDGEVVFAQLQEKLRRDLESNP